MTTAILTGVYNEYGYVIRKNGRVIYAAGNHWGDSQDYVGIYVGADDGLSIRMPLLEDADVYSVEEIRRLCIESLMEACEYPTRYGIRGKHKCKEVVYDKDLNPLEAAYKCGSLTR